jgi:hypothetical protein
MGTQAQNLLIVAMTYLTFTIHLSFTTCGINMAALLSTCTKEEWHAVIQYLQAEVIRGAAIHQRLSPQYEESFATKMADQVSSIKNSQGANPH